MNEYGVSMQTLKPAWVSATQLWDNQNFHINCQWSCQKFRHTYEMYEIEGNEAMYKAYL